MCASRELDKHGYNTIERGQIDIKGKGEMTTYLLLGSPTDPNIMKLTDDTWEKYVQDGKRKMVSLSTDVTQEKLISKVAESSGCNGSENRCIVGDEKNKQVAPLLRKRSSMFCSLM